LLPLEGVERLIGYILTAPIKGIAKLLPKEVETATKAVMAKYAGLPEAEQGKISAILQKPAGEALTPEELATLRAFDEGLAGRIEKMMVKEKPPAVPEVKPPVTEKPPIVSEKLIPEVKPSAPEVVALTSAEQQELRGLKVIIANIEDQMAKGVESPGMRAQLEASRIREAELTRKITPTIPKAEPGLPEAEVGMPEAGLQPEMFGKPAIEVRPAGKGVIKQAGLEDYAKYREAMAGKVLSKEEAEITKAGLDLRYQEIAKRVDEGRATLEAMEAEIDPRIRELAEIIPKAKKAEGELAYITKGEYRKLWGRKPSPQILTADKKGVRWEYALDEKAQELGLEPVARAEGKNADEYLKNLIEQANKQKQSIKATRAEVEADESTLKAIDRMKADIDRQGSLIVADPIVWDTKAVTKETEALLGITKEIKDSVVKNPASGEMFPTFYRKIYEFQGLEETLGRLYPDNYETQIGKIAGKIPAGKKIIEYINPSLRPTETLAGQRAQEAVAIYRDRIFRQSVGKRAIVEDIARSMFPEGDAVKHFGVDEAGRMTKFPPKAGFKDAPRGIVDAIEHYGKFDFDDVALKFIKYARTVIDDGVKGAEAVGIKFNKKLYEVGEAGYFPRVVMEAHGAKVPRPVVRALKPRFHPTQMEAIEKGIVYTRDMVTNLGLFTEHMNNLIATKELQKAINVLGRTPKDSVPGILKAILNKQAQAVKDLQYVRNRVRWEKLSSVTLKAIERKTPQYLDDVKGIQGLTGKERTGAIQKLVKTIGADFEKARGELGAVRKEYTIAMRQAQNPILGVEARTKNLLFQGRLFPKEVAEVLDKTVTQEVPEIIRGVKAASTFMRTAVAAGDLSAGFIQGALVLGRRPDIWAKVYGKSIKLALDPAHAVKFFSLPENTAIRMRYPEIIRAPAEFYEAMGMIGRVPKIGKAWEAVLRPFERQFSIFGDMSRVEMAKALEPAFIKAGKIAELGTYVNRMTFVMDSRALGIGATQNAIEQGFLFFAARYTRAGFAYLGYLLRNPTNIVGREAWRSLAQLATGGTLAYVGFCKALGQEPKFDITRPAEFMTVEIGGTRVGLGGLTYGIFKLIVEVACSVASAGGREPSDLISSSRFDNPVIKFLYSRTAMVPHLFFELWSHRDYMGYPIEGVKRWAQWLVAEHFLPLWLEAAIPREGERAPAKATEAAAQFLGFRAYPTTPLFYLGDKYAQEAYGKDWEDLYSLDKEGKPDFSRLTSKQSQLLARYPDLKEAYTTYREQRSKWWKAEHGIKAKKPPKPMTPEERLEEWEKQLAKK